MSRIPFPFHYWVTIVQRLFMTVLFTCCFVEGIRAADFPKMTDGDAVLTKFKFATGETLPEVRMHYRTLGLPRRNPDGVVTNAVLILHGTGGSGASLVEGAGAKLFAAELFGPGQPLDATQYYIIVVDNLGHGKSSKPSDDLKARFPRYGYEDMILAQHRLLTETLKVNHLRLVMGTSMGGMHTWRWGSKYPEFMDALLPLASLPTQISGRNRLWRRMISDAIRNDPEWKDGEYKTQPRNLKLAVQMSLFVSGNPLTRQKEAPTLKEADAFFEKAVAARLATTDANDMLYAIESSRDYDPGPGLTAIKVPLLAINFADDLINPPELGILEREIKNVKHGTAVLIPLSDDTVGHGTHTKAAVWKHHLVKLLAQTER